MARPSDHVGQDDSDIFASIREAAESYDSQTNPLNTDPNSVVSLELIWHNCINNRNVNVYTMDTNPGGSDIVATYDTSYSSSDDQVIDYAEGVSASAPSLSPAALPAINPPVSNQVDQVNAFGLASTVGDGYVPNRREHRCSVCGKSYKKKCRAEQHEKTHEDPKPYRCDGACGKPDCRKPYKNADGLKRHCLPDEKKQLECPYCKKKILRQNIARHTDSCSKKEVRTVD